MLKIHDADKTSKTYKTRESAKLAALETLRKCHLDLDKLNGTVFVCASESGRFYPIIQLRDPGVAAMYGAAIAMRGFYVTN